MKKALIFLFVLALVFTLWACSSSEESDAQSLGASSTEESVGEESVVEESVVEKIIEYDMIYVKDSNGEIYAKEEVDKRINEANKNGTETLTLEKLIDISNQKESSISWSDFDAYNAIVDLDLDTFRYDAEDGLHTLRSTLKSIRKIYMINNETTLTIKGDDLDEVPHLISLRFIDNKTRKTIIYDIRNGDLCNVLENGVESNIRGQKVEFEGSKIRAPYPEMYEDLTPHRCNLSGANTNSILASKIAIAIKDENDLSEILSHFTSLSEYSFYKELMELKNIDLSKKSLIIVPVNSGTGSARYSISEIRKDGDSLYLDIKLEMPELGTSDLASWFLVATVDKSALEGVEHINAIQRWNMPFGYETYTANDEAKAHRVSLKLNTSHTSFTLTFDPNPSYPIYFRGTVIEDDKTLTLKSVNHTPYIFVFKKIGDTYVFDLDSSQRPTVNYLTDGLTFTHDRSSEMIEITYDK